MGGNHEDGFTFKCQHGHRECEGNIVQACALHYNTDMHVQTSILNCIESASWPELAGKQCFDELGLDWAPVEACINGREGPELHAANGDKTHALNPSLYGVPWPTWDGVGGEQVLDEMDRLGLVGYLCQTSMITTSPEVSATSSEAAFYFERRQ